MLLLLPLLAALQYHWLGQLRDSEREQMQTHLKATVSRFAADFDREITRVYAAFLPDPSDMEEGDENRGAVYTAKYNRWTTSTAYSGLVKSLYLASANEQRQIDFAEFDATTREFTAVAWPAELGTLETELRKNLERQPGAGPPPQPADRPGPPPPGVSPILDLPSPTLVVPIRSFNRNRGEMAFRPPQLAGYAIIVLDRRYIQQEFLPALLKRNFLADDGASYDVKIVERRDPSQLIFPLSSPETSQQNVAETNPDASAPLFGLRMEEMREIVRVMRQRSESREPPRRERMMNPGPPMPAFRAIFEGDQQRLWEIRLRHHAGSLEAAVSKMRRQNLIIGFSVLALLGASVGLLIVSARRASALARQQMDFVAGVSHELRTPLAVIESAAYNLDKGVVKTPQQMQSYGSLIRKETGRLKEMVEQMLEYAGVQSGRQPYNLQPSNLNNILDDVLASSQPLLAEGGFEMQTEIAPDLPPILADQTALARAIQNLLNNAMKYSGESRWIKLSAQSINRDAGPSVGITISDHGMGIPADEQAHIFEPFYRGAEARAAQIHGNGLGLSLVKTIIAAHNGTITVKSAPNAGSTFLIALPTIVASTITDEGAATLGAKLSYEQANPAGRR